MVYDMQIGVRLAYFDVEKKYNVFLKYIFNEYCLLYLFTHLLLNKFI